MKTYGQFCPVAKTAEIFAERWTPLIIRELCFGPKRFNELRNGLPLISRTLLSQRLRELEAVGVVESLPKASGVGRIYRLTPAGLAFRPLIEMMGAWSQRWGHGEVTEDDLDPGLLLWSIRRQIRPELMPPRSFVMQFEFLGVPKRSQLSRYWWLVLNNPDVEVCQKNPGYDVDLVIHADLGDFTRLWLGQIGLEDLQASNGLILRGSEEAQRIATMALGLQQRTGPKDFIYGAPLDMASPS